MKTFVIFCLVGCAGLALVNGEGVRTPSEKDTSLLDEILKKITSSIANVKAITASKGFYEVVDDGSIHFARSTTPDAAVTTTISPTTTTSEPSLSDDESEKDYVDGGEEEEGTFWEFVPRRATVHDPLRDEEEFPLLDTNEVEAAEESLKKAALKFGIVERRRRRDVNVDVGGSHGVDVAVNKPGKNVAVNVGGHGGSGSSSGVDVAVNKPGSNVAVNVGGIQDFLSQFGIHFNGGKPSGTYGATHGGSGGNVDVNVGGKPGHNNNVDVSVNKPYKGNTNVAVDWASFIPFVNVGVNKKNGGSKVDVNVGQNGGSGGASLVDVQVDKDEEGKPVQQGRKKVIVRAPFVDVNVDEAAHAGAAAGDVSSHKKKVVVHAPFVDLDIDGDFPPPPPPHHPPHPHHPPKKHHYKHHPHDDGDKNVAVNVGGSNGGWPFVNVNVDSDSKAPHGKAAGRKCIKINVPFVNVLLNRAGCDEQEAGPTPA